MIGADVPFAEPDLPEDEAEDARYLACLIAALQEQAALQGHPQVAAALTDALDAAKAIANGKDPKGTAH